MNFYHNSDRNELNATQQQHHAQDQDGPPPNVVAHQLDNQEIEIDQQATDEKKYPHIAKQVHGLLHVFFEKQHQQQITHNLEGTAEAVFGFAKLARVVLDVYLGNFCSFEVCQNRNKAVQFAVQTQVFGQVRFQYL